MSSCSRSWRRGSWAASSGRTRPRRSGGAGPSQCHRSLPQTTIRGARCSRHRLRYVAVVAFPIVTLSVADVLKVRRGEDWRRSGHNATTQVVDKPHHHAVGHYAATAASLVRAGAEDLAVWGHDHEGAYRQCPLSDRSLLSLPRAPTGSGPHALQPRGPALRRPGRRVGLWAPVRLARSPGAVLAGHPGLGLHGRLWGRRTFRFCPLSVFGVRTSATS